MSDNTNNKSDGVLIKTKDADDFVNGMIKTTKDKAVLLAAQGLLNDFIKIKASEELIERLTETLYDDGRAMFAPYVSDMNEGELQNASDSCNARLKRIEEKERKVAKELADKKKAEVLKAKKDAGEEVEEEELKDGEVSDEDADQALKDMGMWSDDDDCEDEEESSECFFSEEEHNSLG